MTKLRIAFNLAKLVDLRQRLAQLEKQKAALAAESALASAGSEEDVLTDIPADSPEMQRGLESGGEVFVTSDSDCLDSHIRDPCSVQKNLPADSAECVAEALLGDESLSSARNIMEPKWEARNEISKEGDPIELTATSGTEMNIAERSADILTATADTVATRDTESALSDSQDPLLSVEHGADRSSMATLNYVNEGDLLIEPSLLFRKGDDISSSVSVDCAVTVTATAETTGDSDRVTHTSGLFNFENSSSSALEEKREALGCLHLDPESPPALSGGETSTICAADDVDNNVVGAAHTEGARPLPVDTGVQPALEVEAVPPVVVEAAEGMDRGLDGDLDPALPLEPIVIEDLGVHHQGIRAPLGLFDIIHRMYVLLDAFFLGPLPDPPVAAAAPVLAVNLGYFDFGEQLINLLILSCHMASWLVIFKLGPAIAVRKIFAAFGVSQPFETACLELVNFLLFKMNSPVLSLPFSYEWSRYWPQILFLFEWLVGASALGFVLVIAGELRTHATVFRAILHDMTELHHTRLTLLLSTFTGLLYFYYTHGSECALFKGEKYVRSVMLLIAVSVILSAVSNTVPHINLCL